MNIRNIAYNMSETGELIFAERVFNTDPLNLKAGNSVAGR